MPVCNKIIRLRKGGNVMLLKRFIGDKAFYKKVFVIALPILLQNVITNFVSLLDNIMVGRVGTEQMSGVAIVNQLVFFYILCVFGGTAGALLLLLLRKKAKQPWIRELTTRFLVLTASCVLSTFFVSSGRIFTSYVGVIDQFWGLMIPINTALLTLILYLFL